MPAFKTIIIILIVALVAVVALAWFYGSAPTSNEPPVQTIVSRQFSGVAQGDATAQGVDLLGAYIVDDQKNVMGAGTTFVKMRIGGNTVITRTVIAVATSSASKGFGFSKPLSAENKTSENVGVEQFLLDMKASHLVLTVEAMDNIYGHKEFDASVIRYTKTVVK